MEIDRRLQRVTGAPLRAGNQLRLLQNGSETYDDWFAAMAQAKNWIHLENYIFQNDTIGKRFAGALAERAPAGVAAGHRRSAAWMDGPPARRATEIVSSGKRITR